MKFQLSGFGFLLPFEVCLDSASPFTATPSTTRPGVSVAQPWRTVMTNKKKRS